MLLEYNFCQLLFLIDLKIQLLARTYRSITSRSLLLESFSMQPQNPYLGVWQHRLSNVVRDQDIRQSRNPTLKRKAVWLQKHGLSN